MDSKPVCFCFRSQRKISADESRWNCFASHFPAAQLHWMIADKSENIVVESMADGLHIYDNPAGVLTNNPPFPMQMFALNNYAALSSRQPENNFPTNSTYRFTAAVWGL